MHHTSYILHPTPSSHTMYHISHIIYHISHITYHISHVIYHISYIMYNDHTSYIIYNDHISHLIYHTSYIIIISSNCPRINARATSYLVFSPHTINLNTRCCGSYMTRAQLPSAFTSWHWASAASCRAIATAINYRNAPPRCRQQLPWG